LTVFIQKQEDKEVLEASCLKFAHEDYLYLEKGPQKIKPDFTIWVIDFKPYKSRSKTSLKIINKIV